METKGPLDASGNHLTINGVDLVDLCDKFGTPLFVFNESLLRENYRKIRDTFETRYPNTIIAYSIKTNNNLAICDLMRQEGAYAAVGSGLDLYVAKKAGFHSKHMIFDGLYKSETELRDALKNEVLIINVEAFSELERLNKIAEEMGVKQEIGIRVNLAKRKAFFSEFFDQEAIQGYPSSRFGFSLQDAYTAFKRASRMENLNVVGIMTHPYQGMNEIFLSFINRIQNELGIKIRFLNVGGGFSKRGRSFHASDLVKDLARQKIGLGSKLDKKEGNTNLETAAKSMVSVIKRTLKDMPHIVLEPGRYIVGDAGLLLLRVGCIKEASGHKWVIADGGTNLVPDYWERREIRIANRMNAQPVDRVNIVGPLLYSDDFIAIKQNLPRVQEGDILAVSDVGEYTLSQFNQFLYPRPSVVLLGSDGKVKQIREKETYEDVLRKDRKD